MGLGQPVSGSSPGARYRRRRRERSPGPAGRIRSFRVRPATRRWEPPASTARRGGVRATRGAAGGHSPAANAPHTRGVDHALDGRGGLGGCVAELNEAEPLRGQCGQLGDRRLGPEEMKRIDQDSGVGPIDGSAPRPLRPADPRSRTTRGTRGPPSVRTRSARSQRRPNRSVARSRSGSFSCPRTCRAPIAAAASSTPRYFSGSSSGPSRASSTSSTCRPVSCEALRDTADHLRIPDERRHVLAFSDGCHPNAGVVVAGVGGDLDQVEGRGAEHREVSEGELDGHRRVRATSSPCDIRVPRCRRTPRTAPARTGGPRGSGS